MRKLLADLEEDARRLGHRRARRLRDLGDGRRLRQHLEAGDVGGEVGGDAAFAEALAPPALELGLARAAAARSPVPPVSAARPAL